MARFGRGFPIPRRWSAPQVTPAAAVIPPPPPTVGGTSTSGVITYYAYDAQTLTLLAELPLTSVTWSQRLNAAGNFTATLDMADLRVQALGPLVATRPGRTLLIVDVDGSIQWAGFIWTRQYNSTKRTVSLGGNELWNYWSSRIQAADYSAAPHAGFYWASSPAPSYMIAAQIINDALASPGTGLAGLAISVNQAISDPLANYISPTYPLSSAQDIASIVSLLSASGYGTGFDFAIDPSWSLGQGSTPVFTLNLSYPRRGRMTISTGLTLDIQSGTAYELDEDSTKQYNSVLGVAGGGGGLQVKQSDPNLITAGYPLLETRVNFSLVNSASALTGAVADVLALAEWPVVTAAFTVPMFGDPSLGSFLMGDDMRVIIAADERYPAGLDTSLRVTGLDAAPADSGLSTMKLTLTAPPALAPIPQPPV